MFFRASDGSRGTELWRSDGTTAGTTRIADINPGAADSSPRELTAMGDSVFFTADDGSSGEELWKSDGTAAGTVRVADINPGASGSAPRYLTRVGNTLLFRADDGSGGGELWRSDGTAAGTAPVGDIRSGASGSEPGDLQRIGNTLYFRADDGVAGSELWSLDTRPAFAITPARRSQPEGDSGATSFSFDVSRSGSTAEASTVRFVVTGSGRKRAGDDDFIGNRLPKGTLAFAPGERSQTITINVRGDRIPETDESFTVILRDAVAATIQTARAGGSIRNDDSRSRRRLAARSAVAAPPGHELPPLSLPTTAWAEAPALGVVQASVLTFSGALSAAPIPLA